MPQDGVKLARLVLALCGLSFVGLGVASTVWPLPMARLVEIPLPTPTARIDFAATYGGFELGFGVFLLVSARRRNWLVPGLWAAASALAGFAVVRILGLVAAAGPATRLIYLALALEIAGCVISILALRGLRRVESAAARHGGA